MTEPDASTGRLRGATTLGAALLPALASGLAAVAGATAVGGDWPGALVGAMAWLLLLVAPDGALAWGILTLQDAGRPLLVVAAAALCVLLLAAVAAVVVRVARANGQSRAEAIFGTGVAQAGVVFFVAFRPASALAAGLLGGTVLALSGVTVTGSRTIPGRRRLLRGLGVALGAMGVAWTVADRPSRVPDEPLDDPAVAAMLDAAADRSFELPGTERLVSERFFEVDINTSTPVVDREEWSLWIGGEGADSALTLSYDDLTAREVEHRFVTLRCVSDEINGDLMDTALWTGTPIAPLLEEANAPEDCCVYVEAADGYYHAFPRAALENGFLAWRMNGDLLPRGHGHPVRALIPGHWGEINVKWITRIEIRDEPATSYWERHGWHGDGPVSTVAKIHSVAAARGETDVDDAREGDADDAREGDGTSIVVGGHAYAGTRGVSGVEVSVDGGETWTDADLSASLPGSTPAGSGSHAADGTDEDGHEGPAAVDGEAADGWRMWRHEYVASEPHEVVARAIEADGTTQPSEETDPYPEGASGRVSRRVDPDGLR